MPPPCVLQTTVRKRIRNGDRRPVDNVLSMSDTWDLERERREERRRRRAELVAAKSSTHVDVSDSTDTLANMTDSGSHTTASSVGESLAAAGVHGDTRAGRQGLGGPLVSESAATTVPDTIAALP